MKLTFLGATHEVTGSCFYLEACDKKILIDYGMEQGVDYFENKPVPVPADQIGGDGEALLHYAAGQRSYPGVRGRV